ncbi:DEAD/DEAH box helicase [Desulfobulbus sp.]|uniref:DEAD/DEAH box helicase n=1 Tax=Desulfobulbus sp. TaxID=895 RepID=UPI00286F8A49|nr:DEAD/DEAH box helicase [Desulfobulbus sp.]
MLFHTLPLPESLSQGIADAGFTECTPIQALTLPLSLAGKDVAGQGQTGTGKTAAFLITLFDRLLRVDNGGSQPRALILAPTRELVVQIEHDARLLGRHCGFSVLAVYGGVDYEKQRETLRAGVDIVIGTPGRLIDYLKQGVCRLDHVQMLVIDEADRMFDLGFIGDLRYILRRLPSYDRRQNLMFSATLNHRVMELAYEFMNMPEQVKVNRDHLTADNIEEVLYHVAGKEKFPLLLGLLRREAMERVMIFVNTKREGERLQALMTANDCTSRMISGDVPQEKRLRIMRDFKAGKLPILIATDVASRGLHIEGVSHVVNYDLPEDSEDYVHRIGRTARAGATGKAISLADERGALSLEDIETYIGHSIPTQWAEDELLITEYKRAARPPRSGGKGGPASRVGEGAGKKRPHRRRR